MKTFLFSILTLAMAAGSARAEDQDAANQPKPRHNPNRPPPRQVAPARTVTQPKVQPNLPAANQFRNKPSVAPRNYVPKSYTPEIAAKLRNNSPKFTPPNQDAAVANVPKSSNDWRNNPRYRNQPRELPPVSTTVPSTTQQSNTTVQNSNWRNRDTTNNPNRNWQNNTNRNWQNNTNRNRNWQNNSNVWSFDQARRHHRRDRHDRSWWRSRYSRIALFAGGYYYWNSGYWYPAYGYDPYYSTYTYDEPIYGYGNLEPGQVIANVQSALQEQGYYDDTVDGLIGPNTRAALSAFQRDQGLPITAAIDGPTLQALGLY